MLLHFIVNQGNFKTTDGVFFFYWLLFFFYFFLKKENSAYRTWVKSNFFFQLPYLGGRGMTYILFYWVSKIPHRSLFFLSFLFPQLNKTLLLLLHKLYALKNTFFRFLPSFQHFRTDSPPNKKKQWIFFRGKLFFWEGFNFEAENFYVGERHLGQAEGATGWTILLIRSALLGYEF